MEVLPKIREFLDQLALIKNKLAEIGFKQTQTNTREALANVTARYMTDYDKTIIAIDDLVYNGHYPVPLRIYHPKPEESLPVAVFLHGGGHLCGSITVYDGICRKLAKETGQTIVAVDYRLAPESPYPCGLQDCKAAIRGLFKVLDERKIKYSGRDLTLIGDSAGGALCASLIMDKEFVAVEQIRQQILIYPSLDYTATAPSMTKFSEGYFLERAKMEWYFDNYLQNNENRKELSPVYNEFYANMPATLIFIASHDPLHDEGILYYNNMLKVGAKAELVEVPGVIHAYLMLENLCPDQCTKTYQEIKRFLIAK